MSHTPGPWRAGRPDMATIVGGFGSKWVYAGEKYIAVASGQDIESWKEIMSNAHLIAAAPDLLSALDGLLTVIGAYRRTTGVMDGLALQGAEIAAKDAIKKARGERK